MTKKEIDNSMMHKIPADLRKALTSTPEAQKAWDTITPLARNEWICWVTLVKNPKTRKEHIKRACAELTEGERRPCCWPGCPHRRPKAKKWFKNLEEF